MVRTARDLMTQFMPAAVYTCSDEITAIFLPPAEQSVYPYGGRVQKFVSVSAGFVSVRFNYHLGKQNYEADPALGHKIAEMNAFFDSRIGVVDSPQELFVSWSIMGPERLLIDPFPA